MKIILISLFFVSSLANVCDITMPDGKQYDLSPLAKKENITRQISHFRYQASFCNPLPTPCNRKLDSPASVFVGDPSMNTCYLVLANNWQTTNTYLDPNDPKQGIKLKLPPGDVCRPPHETNYKLEYHLHCDQSEEIKFTNVMKMSSCEYNFIFMSKYGCVGAASSGWIHWLFYNHKGDFSSFKLLLTLSSLFMLYLSLFVYIRFKKNPEDGFIKAFPHRKFWLAYLNYSYFGINITAKFVVRKVKQLNSYFYLD